MFIRFKECMNSHLRLNWRTLTRLKWCAIPEMVSCSGRQNSLGSPDRSRLHRSIHEPVREKVIDDARSHARTQIGSGATCVSYRPATFSGKLERIILTERIIIGLSRQSILLPNKIIHIERIKSRPIQPGLKKLN